MRGFGLSGTANICSFLRDRRLYLQHLLRSAQDRKRTRFRRIPLPGGEGLGLGRGRESGVRDGHDGNPPSHSRVVYEFAAS